MARLLLTLVVATALLAAAAPARAQTGTAFDGTGTAFDGTGMWIWYVAKAGTIAEIAAEAQRRDVATVFVKAADGTERWGQFNTPLVEGLQDAGLNVCAWQFVYGIRPAAEARRGAEAVERGADCLVTDAESRYEGRYAQAERYIDVLRDRIGDEYPLGLSSFPYVDLHPRLPYSVFLGPRGAQVNLPQAYWRDIGDTVDETLEHTYATNLPYGRLIAPTGQLYQNPPARQVRRFRQLATAAGAPGVNWWSWQHATPRGWRAATTPLPYLLPEPLFEPITLTRTAKGDLVRRLQQLLDVPQTARMDGFTRLAVRQEQVSAGLPATGDVDPETWDALLALEAG